MVGISFVCDAATFGVSADVAASVFVVSYL